MNCLLNSLSRSRRFALALMLGLLFSTGVAAAGQPAAGDAAAADLKPALESRLAEAKALLGSVLTTTNVPAGATSAEAAEYRLLAESLVLIFQQHLDELTRLGAVRQQHQELEQPTRAAVEAAESGPYSILFVDDLRDSIQSLNAQASADETSRQVLLQFAAEARARLEASDGQLRQLAEQLETARDVEQVARLNWLRTVENARSRLALASAALNQTRQQLLETLLANDHQRLALLRRRLALVEQRTRFPQADFDRIVAGLEAERRGLETELHSAEAEHTRRQRDLAAAREELRRMTENPADAQGASAEQADNVRRLQALVDVRIAQAETSALQLIELRQLLEVIIGQHALWQMRFDTFHARDATKRRQGYQRLAHAAALVQAARPHFVQQSDAAARRIAEQQNRLRESTGSPADLAQAQELLEAYRQRENLAQRTLRELAKLERLTQRGEESLDEDRRALPFLGRARELFSGFSGFASNLWNFELFAAQDTITVDGQPITGRRSVTVGKISMALLILVAGYWAAALLARLLERVAVRRLKVEPNRANLIQRWTRAALVIALVVFSMVSVKIPLTVFAFLGGTLAIGLGFGTQNLLKNFISGIIILFERPFRVGDVLEVEGRRGTITSIGIRSSVLLLWDGTEMLVPNSTLLETNLMNWTYSQPYVRFSLVVGVVYGANTRLVGKLLTEIADRHGLVLKEPRPEVLFQEFGESDLRFELRYWLNLRQHNAAQVASDLRHMVASTFADHGIELAFPQRDVHLDNRSPLRVQVMPQTEAPPPGAAPEPRLNKSSKP